MVSRGQGNYKLASVERRPHGELVAARAFWIPRANLCAFEVVGSNPASATKTPGQTQESLAVRIIDRYHHAEMTGMMVHLRSDLERYLSGGFEIISAFFK